MVEDVRFGLHLWFPKPAYQRVTITPHPLWCSHGRMATMKQGRSDLPTLRAQISLNTALEQLYSVGGSESGHWGQRPDLNWNFEGMNLVCFHYTTLRYVRHFVRMPQTGQKKNRRIKMPFLVLGWMTGFEPANVGVKVPCLTTWRHPNVMRPKPRGVGGGIRTHTDFPCDFESQLSANSSTQHDNQRFILNITFKIVDYVLAKTNLREFISRSSLSFSLFLYYHNLLYLSIGISKKI